MRALALFRPRNKERPSQGAGSREHPLASPDARTSRAESMSPFLEIKQTFKFIPIHSCGREPIGRPLGILCPLRSPTLLTALASRCMRMDARLTGRTESGRANLRKERDSDCERRSKQSGGRIAMRVREPCRHSARAPRCFCFDAQWIQRLTTRIQTPIPLAGISTLIERPN